MLLEKYTTHWTVNFEQVREILANETLYIPDYNKYTIFRFDWVKGKGGFWWFDDLQDLKFFLTHVWPVYNYMSMVVWTIETHVDFHVFQSWWKYVAGMDNLKVSEVVKLTNKYFYGENDVVCWAGTLKELECSPEVEPAVIRWSFHKTRKKISEKEKPSFKAHVSNKLTIQDARIFEFRVFERLVRYLEEQKKKRKA